MQPDFLERAGDERCSLQLLGRNDHLISVPEQNICQFETRGFYKTSPADGGHAVPDAIVVPGTLRDSLFLLSVVLEQQTELQPVEIMTDTGAYTDVVFGLFWLL